MINFVRSEANKGHALPKVWTTAVFEDEQYLKPTMKDDAVLYSLDDIDESTFDSDVPPDDREQEIQELRERLAQVHIQFTAYREEANVQFQKRLKKMDDTPTPTATQPDSQPGTTDKAAAPLTASSSSQEDQDAGYFTSYASNTIHETMLKDTVRTSAYRDFIYTNKHLFAGKTILDVGCGTGILSLFCARAGAARVLAVDNSGIIDKARVIVYEAGYQDVIQCLRGRVEDVVLPVARVDVIVSEWMGYGLLYESMLDSVLWARDRYLDPAAGLMVPSHATLRIAPLIDADLRVEHVDFWTDVYGFDMRCMLEGIYDEALVRVIDPGDVGGGESVPVVALDLHTARPTDLTFLHPFALQWPSSPDPSPRKSLDGFALWFDVLFATSRSDEPPALSPPSSSSDRLQGFSTGPAAPPTHWQQVALLAKVPNRSFAPGEVVRGMVGYQRREGRGRSVEIEISWGKGAEKEGEEEKEKEKGKDERRQVWLLD